MNIHIHFPSATQELNVFDLEIAQEEGHFATARLTIEAGMTLPPAGTEGIIKSEDTVFFKGILSAIPEKIEGDVAQILLLARPMDFEDKLATLQTQSRIPPYWDPLWVRPDKWKDFHELQGARTASLYCDRRDGSLSWSDWFTGRQSLNLQDNFFFHSLVAKRVTTPLHSCTVKVHAHWIQRENGVANLGPALAKAFPHSQVSTYTKKALTKKWPTVGQTLGKSGVWVLKSELKPMDPPPPLPRFSPPLSLGDSTYRVERFWFQPVLWVGWTYHQRRKETLTFTMSQSGEGHKTLEFVLQNINPDPEVYPWRADAFYREGSRMAHKSGLYRCTTSHRSSVNFEDDSPHWQFDKAFYCPLGDPARASFFPTTRGLQATEHALERAKVELAKSGRAFEVSFEGAWDTLHTITTDMSVTLKDGRLPGGSITGKVIRYTLIARGDTGEQFVRVTLACALTKAVTPPPNDDNSFRTSPTGIRYKIEETPPPQRDSGPLLRNIELINGPDEQEQIIAGQHQTPAELQKALTQKSTQLRLFFGDLRTRERVDHTLRALVDPVISNQ